MKCKNCEWYDDDTNTCNHPASPKSYEDVGPEDGCETGSLNRSFVMTTKDKPNKVTMILKIVITGKFRDDESFEETVRYYAEQALEDAGFDVDVSIMRNNRLPSSVNSNVQWT